MKKALIVLIIIAIFVVFIYFVYQETGKEKEQMFSAARELIMKYSVPDMEVELNLIKKVGNLALVEVIPLNTETDNVAVILEKVEGEWKARDFGTIFPEWEEKAPELFE